MTDLTPRTPRKRPLLWSDAVLDLQDIILTITDSPVYLVGGIVRDVYLHRPVKDIDLVVPQNAIRLAKKLADALSGDVYIMDADRDVARVFGVLNSETLTIDIASFRGDTLLEDLTARDFRANAMAVDMRGDMSQFIDPCGGEISLENRFLQRCTPDSLQDDPLRVLRAVRQSTQLKLRIEPETLKDVRLYGKQLNTVSPERIRDEFYSLLKLDKVAAALRIAMIVDVLPQIFPGIKVLQKHPAPEPGTGSLWDYTLLTIEKMHQILLAISPRRTDETAAAFGLGVMVMQFDRYRSPLNEHLFQTYANDRPHRPLLLLLVLLHAAQPVDDLNYAETVAEYIKSLRLSSAETKRLLSVLMDYEYVASIDISSALEMHRFWYQVGDAGIDMILLFMATYLGRMGAEIRQEEWLEMVEHTHTLLNAWFESQDTIVNPALYVNGNDLMTAFDLEGGRIIGDLLTLIREAQVEQRVASSDEALALAANYLNQ
ncbi:MAG: hypothetical protein ACPG7F_07265 [Aggregatilineales bacterium]